MPLTAILGNRQVVCGGRTVISPVCFDSCVGSVPMPGISVFHPSQDVSLNTNMIIC
jgi:hypothetical protein